MRPRPTQRHRAARARRRGAPDRRGEGREQATIAQATGQTQRFLSVLAAYRAAKDITLKRMYIETMQDILTQSPSIVVDDKLKGLVPFLSLSVPAPSAAVRGAREPPSTPHPRAIPRSAGSSP